MTNQVFTASIAIRRQVLAAEHAANNSAEETARLLAVMLQKRRELECPISLGAAEVDRAHQALSRTLGSMRSLAIMHKGLHGVAEQVGSVEETDFGPSDTVHYMTDERLKVVA